MNVTGEKVLVRNRTSADSIMEVVWGQDSEVTNLDPPSGKSLNSTPFSIETLDGRHIGSCALYDWTSTDVQLGIRIGDKDYWGKGYGTEATNILVDYCFACTDINRIWLKVLPLNTRAIKSYEKCGFVRAGRLALSGYDFVVMEKRRT